MSSLDWAITAICLLSVLLGVARGVIRELLALAAWVIGIVLALQFAAPLGALIPIEMPASMRIALAALAILITALVVAGLISAAVRAMLAAGKLTAEDRVLGAVFGMARGVLLVGAAVLLAGAAGATSQSWWTDSRILPWVQAGVRFASPWLPEPLAEFSARGRQGR